MMLAVRRWIRRWGPAPFLPANTARLPPAQQTKIYDRRRHCVYRLTVYENGRFELPSSAGITMVDTANVPGDNPGVMFCSFHRTNVFFVRIRLA